ncbi:MAG: flagellar M-ring protein FliF, partial [Thermomicrobium sp.]|nr:flagellar M-ring protein FliF [Thermomicrobium sp.]
TGPIGVPGVDSNVDSYQEGAAGQNQQRSELRESTVNYELSRQVERVVQAPGKIQRLSVAVVLNSAAVDPAVAEQVRDLVAAAAGIVPERGDQVTVSVVPFTTTTADEGAAQPALMDRLLEVARIGAMVLIPLIALLFAWRVLAAQRTALPPVPRYEVTTDVLPGPSGAAATGPGVTVGLPGQPEVALKPPSGPPPTLRELQDLAKKDPATVAHVVRAWLNEE